MELEGVVIRVAGIIGLDDIAAAGNTLSAVAVVIVRFPRNTEPKVDRSEEPLPVRSAAA